MSDSVPQVSVIIPAYNAEAFLGRAIDSVLAQEDCTFELLIVDNNSTDNTATVAQAYVANFPAQVFLLKESVPGASAARNRGLQSARADWIQFLDADDVLLTGKLKRQLGLIGNVDWITGTIIIQDYQGGRHTYFPEKAIWPALLSFSGLGHLDANLFRRATLRQLGGFDLNYAVAEDFDLFFRLARNGNKRRLDFQPSAIHIYHDGPRLSTMDRKKNCHYRLELTQRMLHYLEDVDPMNALTSEPMRNAARLSSLRMQSIYCFEKSKTDFKHLFPQGIQSVSFPNDFIPEQRLFYRMFGFFFIERIRICWRYLKGWLKGY